MTGDDDSEFMDQYESQRVVLCLATGCFTYDYGDKIFMSSFTGI